MVQFRGEKDAFGGPGIEPRWTHGNKDGVGTAYSGDSHIWFTLWRGCMTEVYYPTIDRPQIRDLQFLITDGETFFHDEKRHLKTAVDRFSNNALGYTVTCTDPENRYKITKEIIAAPHLSCVLQHNLLQGDKKFLSKLNLFVLCAPHLEVGGWNNNAYVVEVAGRQLLVAEKNGIWLALGASVPFSRLSCGYVGKSDGWTDISENFKMDWEFDRALKGNVALTGQLDLRKTNEFTIGLAFGTGLHNATTTLLQALGVHFKDHRKRFIEQWQRVGKTAHPLEKASFDEGDLYKGSQSLLLAHEDKIFAGALIASLSIPWGEIKGDEDMGGYHLVWTRDMVNSSMGLLASGNKGTPLRALIYLAASQSHDGGFSQNFWVNGTPYWKGIQLDEVAFPILLAFRLKEEHALGEFDPYSMVIGAARYLMVHGPSTGQERWEEASGYSPSTLAAVIAALVCAACFARDKDDPDTASYLEAYADFLNRHVDDWTVTTEGTLHPEVKRHYIRIHPINADDPNPNEDPNKGMLVLANGPIGSPNAYPAKEIVDAGFLELVRYGIRDPADPLIVDSLKVVDAVLKTETPSGPCWHRYNHDGYGQKENGGCFDGAGKGRLWPLLTGERAHYELAAGKDVSGYIKTLESLATCTGQLPEQVWDEADIPETHQKFGCSTGAAMPLMWAHAEYIKLLRSTYDGSVFDFIPAVGARYLFGGAEKGLHVEIWKPRRHAKSVQKGKILRIQKGARFRLRWSLDGWENVEEVTANQTVFGIDYVDIQIPENQESPVEFTFFWIDKNSWENVNYQVPVV